MPPTSNPARNMKAIVGSGDGIGTGSPRGPPRVLQGEGGISSCAEAFPYVGGKRAYAMRISDSHSAGIVPAP